jgi:beta-glucanase (GH16 family)
MITLKAKNLYLLLLISGLMHAQNWQLVWSDEFTTEIGPDWVLETGTGSSGWGNNELQYYRQENAKIENGELVITAKKESFGGASYTSARLKTEGLKSWTYGKIEASISLPSFQGVWPALWMLGENITSVGWPACGEIDIMEKVNTVNEIHGTIHWQDNNLQYANYGTGTPLSSSGYHTYTVEWDKQFIKWFIDGIQYHIVNIENGVNGTSEFHNNFYVLLNLAIGGNWPGFNVDETALPATMYIDFVRVYQDAISVNTTNITPLKTTFELFPNPTNELLYLKLTSLTPKMNYTITNTLGIIVQQSTLTENKISVDKLFPGFYSIVLSNGQRAKFCKR